MKKKEQRILGRQLARELTKEELGLPTAGGLKPGKPPVSTLAATLPDYSEDS